MIIELNGIKYQQIEQPKRKPMTKTMLSMLMMAEAFNSLDPFNKKPKATPKVDIVKEFGLIQLKKSNLSRNQREWVVWQFNKNFKPITQ
jgi:hypothetical protein